MQYQKTLYHEIKTPLVIEERAFISCRNIV